MTLKQILIITFILSVLAYKICTTPAHGFESESKQDFTAAVTLSTGVATSTTTESMPLIKSSMKTGGAQ